MYKLKASVWIAGGLLAASAMHAEKKTNIVLIYVDDMGYGDISVTGATGYSTPHIDQLCTEGTFFTHYYSPEAVSSASRAGLMTGCYPNRVSIKGALMPYSKIGLNPDEEIIPEILKPQGVCEWYCGQMAFRLATKVSTVATRL